jgi:hypothetical protein
MSDIRGLSPNVPYLMSLSLATGTRSDRLEVPLLIHMLATLAAWLAALAADARHEYRFRISLLRRGWESLRGSHRIAAPFHALSQLWRLSERSAYAP